MLEPQIRKGAIVAVETDRFSGAYRVNEYEFKSSSETGDHLVRGTITPAEAAYPAPAAPYGRRAGPRVVR